MREEKDDGHQCGGEVVAAVQCLHRVGVFTSANRHDPNDRAQEAKAADDEREQNSGDAELTEENDAEDHRTDILGRDALE